MLLVSLQLVHHELHLTLLLEPIWFFCKQFGPPSHCGLGMVGAINAPTSGPNTFANYQATAEQLGASQPQDTHTGNLVGVGASATGSAGPVASGSLGSGVSTTAPSTPSPSRTGGALRLSAGSMSLLISLGLAFFL
jgi:hypothetical protein